MTTFGGRGPAVVDTDVFSADLVPGSLLAARYRSLTLGRPTFISFQTAAEIRFGAPTAFHDLRHTAATRAAASGTSLKALMTGIGHTPPPPSCATNTSSTAKTPTSSPTSNASAI